MRLPFIIKSVASQVAFWHFLLSTQLNGVNAFLNWKVKIEETEKESDKEVRSGKWYKLADGRGISQYDTLKRFVELVGYRPHLMLTHPIWHVLAGIDSTLHGYKRLPRRYKKLLVHHWRQHLNSESELFAAMKNTYPQQLLALYQDSSFEALEALLLIVKNKRLNSNQDQHHQSEAYIYALFLYLFCYRYNIKRVEGLTRQFSQILNSVDYSTIPKYLNEDISFVEKANIEWVKTKKEKLNEQSIKLQILDYVQSRKQPRTL